MKDLEKLFDKNADSYALVNGINSKIMLQETFIKVVTQLLSKLPLEKITRLEVIDEKGRSYVNWNKRNVIRLSFQDELKTLKIFISKNDNRNNIM